MRGPCNICWVKEATVSFLTDKFTLPALGEMPPYRDTGTWVTCDDCADVVEAGAEALGAHTIILRDANFPEAFPPGCSNKGIMDAHAKRILTAFVEHRVGEPLPLGLDLPDHFCDCEDD